MRMNPFSKNHALCYTAAPLASRGVINASCGKKEKKQKGTGKEEKAVPGGLCFLGEVAVFVLSDIPVKQPWTRHKSSLGERGGLDFSPTASILFRGSLEIPLGVGILCPKIRSRR